MLRFKYVTSDYDDAIKYSKRLTPDKIKDSLFRPILLYLLEIKECDVYDQDLGLSDFVDNIKNNSNMYFQLIRDDSKNVRYFENGMLCEPEEEYPDSAMVFLLNGDLYLIDGNYKKTISKAKKLLGSPLKRVNDDTFVSKVKNMVVYERENAIIDNLIKHLNVALGLEETSSKYRFEARAVDQDLEIFTEREENTKGHSR